MDDRKVVNDTSRGKNERGRVAYLVLWLMGAPIGLLLLLWVIFGNNLFAPG